MILLNGPDQDLRDRLYDRLAQTNQFVPCRTGPDFRCDLPYLVNQVHLARTHLRNNFTHKTGDSPARYMLGMALAAAGSVAVICGKSSAEELAEFTFGGLIPPVPVGEFSHEDHLAELVQEAWQAEQRRVDPVYDYDSSGGRPDQAIMMVGEGSQDLFDRRRRAFISHTGCSLYLHEALKANPWNRYYLTNAEKTDNTRSNLASLADEIEQVAPRRIIALGGVAARTLADLRVGFEQTYHPQYWKRFKNKEIDQLSNFLK